MLEQNSATEKENPRSYRATKKIHGTLFKKNFFQPMYLEQLCFSINIASWPVIKISSQYTFEQKCFNKNFILMNQRSRQNAKSSIEKDFYKLMNNSNLGYDCHNNLDNCQFGPIFDEPQEITYLKRYYNYFDSKVSSFVSSHLIKQEIAEKFAYEIIKRR